MWLVLLPCQNQTCSQICAGLGIVIVSLVHAGRNSTFEQLVGEQVISTNLSGSIHTLLIAGLGKAAVLLPTTSPSLKGPG